VLNAGKRNEKGERCKGGRWSLLFVQSVLFVLCGSTNSRVEEEGNSRGWIGEKRGEENNKRKTRGVI